LGAGAAAQKARACPRCPPSTTTASAPVHLWPPTPNPSTLRIYAAATAPHPFSRLPLPGPCFLSKSGPFTKQGRAPADTTIRGALPASPWDEDPNAGRCHFTDSPADPSSLIQTA
jgi:hypothetical protein